MFMPLYRRDWAVEIAMRFFGTFYSWGGDDPSAFDCSGLSGEVYTSVGIFPRGVDMTAAGQYAWLKKNGAKCGELTEMALHTITPGSLVFFSKTGDPANIHHVEIVLNNSLSVGASGGGSSTTTKEIAIQQNAFVKVRPIYGRGFKMWFADPFES